MCGSGAPVGLFDGGDGICHAAVGFRAGDVEGAVLIEGDVGGELLVGDAAEVERAVDGGILGNEVDHHVISVNDAGGALLGSEHAELGAVLLDEVHLRPVVGEGGSFGGHVLQLAFGGDGEIILRGSGAPVGFFDGGDGICQAAVGLRPCDVEGAVLVEGDVGGELLVGDAAEMKGAVDGGVLGDVVDHHAAPVNDAGGALLGGEHAEGGAILLDEGDVSPRVFQRGDGIRAVCGQGAGHGPQDHEQGQQQREQLSSCVFHSFSFRGCRRQPVSVPRSARRLLQQVSWLADHRCGSAFSCPKAQWRLCCRPPR